VRAISSYLEELFKATFKQPFQAFSNGYSKVFKKETSSYFEEVFKPAFNEIFQATLKGDVKMPTLSY
jgi:hypothetical protein